MKKSDYLAWAVIVAAAGLAVWLGRNTTERPVVQPGDSSAQVALEGTPAAAQTMLPLSSSQNERHAPAENQASTWATLIRESDDYWAFAEKAHEAAVRGDGAAQWYLSEALGYCMHVYERAFLEFLPDDSWRHRTLEEARQVLSTQTAGHPYVTKPYVTEDELPLVQKRCSRLSQPTRPPFGYGDEWAKKAELAAFPQAQAAAAYLLAYKGRHDWDTAKAPARLAEAQSLAIDSLRTKDPAVMLQIAEVAEVLADGNKAEATRRRLTWELSACLASDHCEALSEMMKARCKWEPECQPYETSLDILRRDAGNDFHELERRARELNEKLDAGTLEDADI